MFQKWHSLFLNEDRETYNIAGFNLLIPMGYGESSPFFCSTTKTIKQQAINSLHMRGLVPEHSL